MKKRRVKYLVVSLITIIVTIIVSSYAYFFIMDNLEEPLEAMTGTTDVLTFQYGNRISIDADIYNFGKKKGNITKTTEVKATLIPNDATNQAKAKYNVFFVIEENSLVYTTPNEKAELIIKITKPDGTNLEYIEGINKLNDGTYDITTRMGTFLIARDYEIEANNEIATQTWKIEVTLINLETSQKENVNHSFRGKIYITKEEMETYKAPEVNNMNLETEYNSLKATLEYHGGTRKVEKYYFGIREVGSEEEIVYQESEKATYEFKGLKEDTEYELYSYVKDSEGIYSNIYDTKGRTEAYQIPTIDSVDFGKPTLHSITATVSATAHEEPKRIYKYYYSIDGGPYEESESNIKIFEGLSDSREYRIKIKVTDVNGRESTAYEKVVSTEKYYVPEINSITVSANTWNSITFSIDATEKTSKISSYTCNLYQGTTAIGVATSNATDKKCTFTNLKRSTTYTIKVKAIDMEGRQSIEVSENGATKTPDGSANNPYIIQYIEDLVNLSNDVSNGTTFDGKYFIVVRNLDFKSPGSYENANRTNYGDINGTGGTQALITELTTGKGFKAIGYGTVSDRKKFGGIFDGNNYTISNLYENNNVVDARIGLFGDASGTIKNLTVTGSITSTVKANVIGGIAGCLGGVMENCKNYVTISGTSYVMGGLIGAGVNTVTNCQNYATLTGDGYVGGIVAYSDNTLKILNSVNYGNITSADAAGGIIGYSTINSAVTVVKSYNTGTISNTSISGGILGYGVDTTNVIIDQSYNTGKISANKAKSWGAFAGGIVGYHYGLAFVLNSYNTGAVSVSGSSKYISANGIGFVGYGGDIYVINSYNKGSISGGNWTNAGIASTDDGEHGTDILRIYNVYNRGTISGKYTYGIDWHDSSTSYTASYTYNNPAAGQAFVNTLNSNTKNINLEKINSRLRDFKVYKWQLGSDNYPELTAEANTDYNFSYANFGQKFLAEKTGNYGIELWGAQGGTSLNNGASGTAGGKGSYTAGTIHLDKGTILYFYVGGAGANGAKGKNSTGGYNGGGLGTWDGSDNETAGAGGGATDVRLTGGTWSDFNSLKTRIMVAAGGGGASWTYAVGAGGGISSDNIYSANLNATQTSGYAFGQGMNASGVGDDDGVGGGGSGYYGGKTRNNKGNTSGAGGSSYISGHAGCNSIDANATSGSITHSGSANHYSGKVFTNTKMVDGNGYNWTNVKGELTKMPNHDGTGTLVGNTGNGYARIYLIS